MIPAPFDYVAPTELGEAVDLLGSRPVGSVRLLAGGHGLVPELRARRLRPALVVDLDRITDLHGIRVGDESDGVWIGAMTTAAEAASHPGLRSAVPLLADAAPLVSDPLIRNRATLGGSVALADSRGDWPAIVLALDAVIRLRGPDGGREVSAADYFGRSVAGSGGHRPDEVLVGLTLPRLPATTRAVYLKRPHLASGWAQVGVAAVLDTDRDGAIRAARIAVAGLGVGPVRVLNAERSLVGRVPDAEATAAAADLAGNEVELPADHVTPLEDGRDLLRVHVRRALTGLAVRDEGSP